MKSNIMAIALIAVFSFIIANISLFSAGVAFEYDNEFWAGFGITTGIGILGRFMLMPAGLDKGRGTQEYIQFQDQLITKTAKVVQAGKVADLNEYVNEINLNRLVVAKEARLYDLASKNPTKWEPIVNKIKSCRTDEDKLKTLQNVKSSVEKYTVNQLLSAGNTTIRKDSLSLGTMMNFVKRAFPMFIMMGAFTLIYQGMILTGSINTQGIIDTVFRLGTFGMAVYSGFNSAIETAQHDEIVVLKKRLGLLNNFR